MTAKEKIIQAVETLPADTTFEEAMERLLFIAKVERGIQQADAGETLSHLDVKERMSKWWNYAKLFSIYRVQRIL